MATTTTFTTSPEARASLVSPRSPVPAEDARPIYTIDQLIKRRAEELQDAPLLGYPRHGVVDFEEHSARAVDRYVDAAVAKLQSLGLPPVDPAIEKPPIIGILAQSGLHVVIAIMSLSRLGYAVFLISTRLASPAITQLLKMTDCHTVLTTRHFHPVLGEVQQERPIDLKPLFAHSDYYGKDAPSFSRACDPATETKKIAVIIHSSGSTGLPKPIYLTHGSCIAAFATNLGMRALIASPLFHSHGFYEVFRSIHSRKPIYLGNYAIPITRQSLMDMIDTVNPELCHLVPYMVKLLAESEEGVQSLAKVKLVLFGGSACPDDLGNRLVDQGVYLVANYGATETGRLMNSTRPPGDKDWNYLRMLPSAKPYVLMDEISPGLYECVALDGLKSKSTINSDNPPRSFRTRDLFIPHPTRPGLWKYACRLDDRFTLINGEKVLPLPIEGRIRQEEIVKEACVFGDGRSFPGVLVVKADRAAHLSDAEFLELLWPAVEDANSRAESFSRIPKELLVILPADVAYPRTDKGTFIRVPMYRQFEAEITAAYDSFENEKGGSLALSGVELEDFLLRRLKEQIGVELPSPETDFFAAGVDSLQCMQVWNLIKRELDLGGRQADLSQNVLYETGNVRGLAAHLTELKKGVKSTGEDELKKMEILVNKYSVFQPHVDRGAGDHQKETVVSNLVTGVTGGLGAHLLAQLASRPNVSAIWAMIRAPSDEAAAERLQRSLNARGLTLGPEEGSKVVPLACDLGRPDLGLDAAKLAQLRSTLTCTIHSAWAVNFNIPVQSFEDQHIKALHNLIQLGLSVPTSKPARFFFCSSVSAAGGSPRPGYVKEGPVTSPAYAQGTGYARSKYVAEHITLNAASAAGAPTRVLRVGQLVGDSKVGEWNATEGIPLMIQTAEILGALPALEEEMTWLPVDYAATAILELTNLTGPEMATSHDCLLSNPSLVYHVLNPKRFHWTRDMLPALASAGLKFDTLSTGQWMEKLRTSDRDAVRNPPIKLLDWFEGKYGTVERAVKTEILEYLTEETTRASVTLATLPDVTDARLIQKMIDSLREHWGSGTRNAA
ncbi:acetyl-CoA synthetase-like protein [Thozetella sp. PMI_491]|nr:acetyl-CoA synthetase-like protein [Thozetella sp. PMI_491]